MTRNNLNITNTYEISIVIPVYNEFDNLFELHNRLRRVLTDDMKVAYEIIFVDDGSDDASWRAICELRDKDSNVRGIRFSRNFGHHFAVTAGLDFAQGDHIVLMDADLQDRPEEVPGLYQKLKEGYDVVYATRTTRDDPVLKKVSSKLFYMLFKILARVEIPPNTGIFRIVNRRTADSIRLCREKARVMIALMTWTGFSQTGIETRREARHAGKTKYNIIKLLRLAVDGITSFSYVPLRIASYVGFAISCISVLLGFYMLIKKVFFGIPILGYASIIIAILFIGGIQLLIIGIMGEYVGRIFTEVQNRPLYLIKEKVGYE
jgi:dolichol-phosphate mannosyltransferase